eukprot:CAMPEP_0168587162 /NCGR_PEP_ID=MMETSP0420-20121227/4717_1 /TAXON_ID=498008 /ORGANISM="Pessonella sp." /LENGTH=614 /DNA_ID=CAMNT_0008622395 /DNA_START=159 /DNA_END=2003 /DNA_ORIENTATION=+
MNADWLNVVYPFGYDTSMATMNDSPFNTTFSVRNSHYHRRTFVLTESQLFDANRFGWQIKVAADDFVIDLYVNGIAINFQGLIGETDFNGQSEGLYFNNIVRFQNDSLLQNGTNLIALSVRNTGSSSDTYVAFEAGIDISIVPFFSRWFIKSNNFLDDSSWRDNNTFNYDSVGNGFVESRLPVGWSSDTSVILGRDCGTAASGPYQRAQLRTTFSLDAQRFYTLAGKFKAMLMFDERVDVYVNGEPIINSTGAAQTAQYYNAIVSDVPLRIGENVIAADVRNTQNTDMYFDLSIEGQYNAPTAAPTPAPTPVPPTPVPPTPATLPPVVTTVTTSTATSVSGSTNNNASAMSTTTLSGSPTSGDASMPISGSGATNNNNNNSNGNSNSNSNSGGTLSTPAANSTSDGQVETSPEGFAGIPWLFIGIGIAVCCCCCLILVGVIVWTQRGDKIDDFEEAYDEDLSFLYEKNENKSDRYQNYETSAFPADDAPTPTSTIPLNESGDMYQALPQDPSTKNAIAPTEDPVASQYQMFDEQAVEAAAAAIGGDDQAAPSQYATTGLVSTPREDKYGTFADGAVPDYGEFDDDDEEFDNAGLGGGDDDAIVYTPLGDVKPGL